MKRVKKLITVLVVVLVPIVILWQRECLANVSVAIWHHTSRGQVPDEVTVQCSGLNVSNAVPYHNKKQCCLFARAKALPQLCGAINNSSIGNESHIDGCTCTDFMACKTVVVSASSALYWWNSLDAIASVQNTMPDVRIKVADLGLWQVQAEYLRRLRNVDVVTFPFETFPPHVRNLKTYAWKPLLIQMLLQQYEVVFYMDSSARLKYPLTHQLLDGLRNFPIKILPNYYYDGAFTLDGTYEYLGVTRRQVGKRIQLDANRLLFRNSSFLQRKIMSHFVDCALHEECIAPPGSSPYGCDMKKYNQQVQNIDKLEEMENIGCHRFDQSVLTVLLEREFHFRKTHPQRTTAILHQQHCGGTPLGVLYYFLTNTAFHL